LAKVWENLELADPVDEEAVARRRVQARVGPERKTFMNWDILEQTMLLNSYVKKRRNRWKQLEDF